MSTSAEARFGAWITVNSTVITEQVARLGFDFMVIDGQHGLLGYPEIRDALIATTAGGCKMPIVRVSSHEPGEIGRMLDAGAHGIIVPMVNSAEEAARVSRAARYATSGGSRSYSPVRHGGHFGMSPGDTDRGIILLVMIETRSAIANIDAILATPGIDGAFVGPYDLSLSLGAEMPFEEKVLPELEAALEKVRTATVKHGKISGIYCGNGIDAIRRAREGFTLVNTTHDMSVLREGMGTQLRAVVESGLCAAENLEEELRAH